MPGVEGLHRVIAIAGQPQVNIDFYTRVLGLRLVKLTEDFDDPTPDRLYYGDGQGHPGTMLTFSPWLGAYRMRIGTDETTECLGTSLKLPPWLEQARPQIQRLLPTIVLPTQRPGERR